MRQICRARGERHSEEKRAIGQGEEGREDLHHHVILARISSSDDDGTHSGVLSHPGLGAQPYLIPNHCHEP